MQRIIPTVDRLLHRYHPLDQVIETLVTRIVPQQTAAACCTTCGVKQITCRTPGCYAFEYYCRTKGGCYLSCFHACAC